MSEMMMVRAYFTEGDKQLEPTMHYLHDEAKVKGVSVFRAVSGFGHSGSLHQSSVLDVSFDLPLAIEFFDDAARVDAVLTELKTRIAPSKIVAWPVKVCE